MFGAEGTNLHINVFPLQDAFTDRQKEHCCADCCLVQGKMRWVASILLSLIAFFLKMAVGPGHSIEGYSYQMSCAQMKTRMMSRLNIERQDQAECGFWQASKDA